MAKDLNRLANLAIVVAALAVGTSTIYDTFLRPKAKAQGLDPRTPPEYVEGWESLSSIGIRSGDERAPVQIVEFADLECPYCAKYEATLQALMKRHEGKVSRVFVHFPLDMHRYARRAAQALECAAEQGAFEPMLKNVYAKQLDFSTNPWSQAALESGVADTARFGQCALATAQHARIEKGVLAAQSIALTGTPSVLINGYLFVGAPQDSALDRAVAAIVRGDQIPGVRSTKPARKVVIN